MGRPTGFEPATPRITILCSNQLSYGRRAEWKKFASCLHAVKAQFEFAAGADWRGSLRSDAPAATDRGRPPR